MPITLIINSIPYQYPIPGDSPGWGEGATDWAEAVTEVLNDLVSPTDILQTTFSVANNNTSSANVSGLSFNTGLVRAAFIKYSIYRVSTSNPSGQSEGGEMIAVYDNSAATGNKWSLTQGPVNGNSGITFTMTDNGQVQYTSTDIGTPGYSGIMKFSATTLAQ
jgi:hypothetical protein